MPTAHIYIKLKGKDERQVFFNRLLRYLDIDWPYGDGKSRTGNSKTYYQCPKCQGMIYHNPTLNKIAVKAAGVQVGIGVKIKQWEDGEKCADVKVVSEWDVDNQVYN